MKFETTLMQKSCCGFNGNRAFSNSLISRASQSLKFGEQVGCYGERVNANLQCVSSKNPPYGFLTFFPKRLGILNHFYTPIILSFLH